MEGSRLRRGPRREVPLAIVFPTYHSRLLPTGQVRRRSDYAAPELPIKHSSEEGKSRAQLAVESNDALRALLVPYFGDDVRRCRWRERFLLVAAALCPTEPRQPRTGDRLRGQGLPVRCTSWTSASDPRLRSAGPSYGSGAGSGAGMGLPRIQMRAPWH